MKRAIVAEVTKVLAKAGRTDLAAVLKQSVSVTAKKGLFGRHGFGRHGPAPSDRPEQDELLEAIEEYEGAALHNKYTEKRVKGLKSLLKKGDRKAVKRQLLSYIEGDISDMKNDIDELEDLQGNVEYIPDAGRKTGAIASLRPGRGSSQIRNRSVK